MRIRQRAASHERDLSVQIDDPAASVADLAAALFPDEVAVPLTVDGRRLASRTLLVDAGICNGALVQTATEPATSPPAEAWVVVLVVSAGRDCGRRFGLPPGRTEVRRREPGEPSWSDSPRRACIADGSVGAARLDVEVDAGGAVAARRGAFGFRPIELGMEIELGRARVRFEAAAPHRLGAGPAAGVPASWPAGTRPLHRRARPPAEAPIPEVELPPLPPPVPTGASMGPATLAASVVSGLAMVALFRSWAYAAFALLGPVLALAGTADARRRARPRGWRHRRKRRRALAALEHSIQIRNESVLAGLHRSLPGPGTALLTAGAPEREGCWARRLTDDDPATVRLGRGGVPVDLPGGPAAAPTDVAAVLARNGSLADAPIRLAFEPGRAVAVAGDPEAAGALVRSIVVQLAVAYGPADLDLEVVAGACAVERWRWCRWLPHYGAAAAASPRAEPPGHPRLPWRLVVIDDAAGLEARRGRAREVLRDLTRPDGRMLPIVLLDDAAAAPAVCSVVLDVAADGSLRGPAELMVGPVIADGVHAEVARDVAVTLARLDDPESPDPDRDLPPAVALADLIGREVTTNTGISRRWADAGADPSPLVVLGTDGQGPVEVNLAADGPHALVAGTTGSGKSELLRTLVAGLATGADPDHLAFVLIDFKGGSAFDACAGLPHIAGSVTDLDADLAARALNGLEAELLRREAALARVGAEDLTAFRRRSDLSEETMPRLVVVVDEFATLAATLPDFVETLVGIAQRGRSLGFHLVLATQRPGGAVSENLRANTSLRVGLRVQTASDSNDVLGDPRAATLPRRHPGRAVLARGPQDLVTFQAARITTVAPSQQVAPVSVREEDAGVDAAVGERAEPVAGSPTDLDALVKAARAAWAAVGGSPPRCPWPTPLPRSVPWPDPACESPDLATHSSRLVLGRGDAPSRRVAPGWWWDLDRGPLLVIGVPGSGTSTALATATLAAARRWAPSDLHVHVIDLGASTLGALAGLPQVGATIGADDAPRQRRLLAELSAELAQRLARSGQNSAGQPRRLLVVDGLLAFQRRWDNPTGDEPWQALLGLLARGSAVGLHVAMAAEGPGVPRPVLAAVRQRLVLALGDRADAAWLGLPVAALPSNQPPGRAVASEGPSPVQLAQPSFGLAGAVAALAGQAQALDGGPRSLGQLRPVEPLADLPASTSTSSVDGLVTLRLIVGRLDADLEAAVLTLAGGSAALVAGPPRSGRTTALLVAVLGACRAGWAVVAVGSKPGPLADHARVIAPGDPELPSVLRSLAGPTLVVVDDADDTADDDPTLRGLVTDRPSDRVVLVAGRSDRLRASWAHWSREVRVDRQGLLLDPDPDLDGELLGTRLPRQRPAGISPTPGLGWLVGEVEGLTQVAWPHHVKQQERY